MLAQESYALHLANCRFVIVDELHSFAGNKRGVDLAVVARTTGGARSGRHGPLCRVGLSATAAPLDLARAFLWSGDDRPCRIAEAKIEKESIVEVFSPIRRKPYPPAGYTGVRLYAELAELIRSRQSVIVFTNVRSAAEQLGLKLKELLPDLADQIEIHHASLDRSVRLEVEDRLKDGELRAVVCSTSLEMGIDIGAVDLVVMVATPKGVSRAIQRIGRSGHSLNRKQPRRARGDEHQRPRRSDRDCSTRSANARSIRSGCMLQPYDVLAQHIVGMAALAPIAADERLRDRDAGLSVPRFERAEFDHILRISGRRRRFARSGNTQASSGRSRLMTA